MVALWETFTVRERNCKISPGFVLFFKVLMKPFIIRSCMFINKCMFTWWNSPAVNTSVMLCLKWLYLMLYFSMTYILPSRQTAQQRTADESKCRCNQRKHSEQYRTHPLLFNPFTLIFLLSFHFTSSVPFLPSSSFLFHSFLLSSLFPVIFCFLLFLFSKVRQSQKPQECNITTLKVWMNDGLFLWSWFHVVC